MTDDRICEEIVTKFFLNTVRLGRRINGDHVIAWFHCVDIVTYNNKEVGLVPLTTGSVAEFYIEPLLSCVGDVDIMLHYSTELAMPAGYGPPTQLPGEFGSRVEVCEILDSEFPGYVYLETAYLLTECVDEGQYNAVPCRRLPAMFADESADRHGPALISEHSVMLMGLAPTDTGIGAARALRSVDKVFCVRCPAWPPQAADWPTRRRNYEWPDSATVDRVVGNGCDVVAVAHRQCRQDEWMSKHQWRLSFSRAEIVLINSWMPLQQIVYHMLRVFVKTERLTESADNSEAGTLSNYHIKTTMLWACELKSRSWWSEDSNVVRICVELLRTLSVWLTDARCQHYFIDNCNLFDQFKNSHYARVTVNRLMSISREWFLEWCIDGYVQKCALLCPDGVSSLLLDPATRPHGGRHRVVSLQNVVSAIVKWRLDTSLRMSSFHLVSAQYAIMEFVSRWSLTLRSCLCWIDQLAKTDHAIRLYFVAVAFLHGARKATQESLKDETLDVLAATCLRSNDARRCHNARHSSVLSLSEAAKLMQVVANSSRSTVQQIEIELAKAYLHRALRCKDSDSDSVYCLANAYLTVLYHATGHHEAAIEHCSLVTRLEDHSQCSSHVVQGELLPTIDDQVDSILGLAVLYRFIRAAELNEEQERRHVSVFATELFAHYLHTKLLSFTEYRQLSDETLRYRSCLCSSPEVFTTDVMLFRFAFRTKYPPDDRLLSMAEKDETKSPILSRLDASKLVELLQQSAVEHLSTCHELLARDFDSLGPGYVTVATDMRALHAYKCGQYRRCLQLSVSNIRSLVDGLSRGTTGPFICMYPELIQLFDDDVVALVGLKLLVNSSRGTVARRVLMGLSQPSLSLYLATRCQIELRHSVTSLATTLDYVRLARINSGQDTPEVVHQLLLQFVEQKILRYIIHISRRLMTGAEPGFGKAGKVHHRVWRTKVKSKVP